MTNSADMPEEVYFEFVTDDSGCRIKRWQRSPFDGCKKYTRSDLSQSRVEAAEGLVESLRFIANGCLVPPDGGAPIWPDDAINAAKEALQRYKDAVK